MAEKVCPVVFRTSRGATEVLAFRHPSAGKQFVKGTIEEGEPGRQAAIRELREESGITTDRQLLDLGQALIGAQSALWHFFAVEVEGLPESWEHQTDDDFGHVFSFFWHPVADDLDEEWHPRFHDALRIIRLSLPHGSNCPSFVLRHGV
ncbi:MAG TPA: NUDIX domain-containing protein [Sphingomicrobium sp.]|nr:NUDIX domain-containing protein [Sphingomicrobium sp.]